MHTAINTGWIKLDQANLDKAERSKQKGVHFEVSMSPYDIPADIRGYYCQSRNKFIIEFRYISDEKTHDVVKKPEGIIFRCGVNSSRLYAIEIDTDKLQVGQVSVGIVQRVQSALQQAKKISLESNDRFRLRGELNQRLLDVAEQHFPRVLQEA